MTVGLSWPQIADRLRRIRFCTRTIPFIWAFAVLAAVWRSVRFGFGDTARDVAMAAMVVIYIPFLLTVIGVFLVRTHRLVLQVDATDKALARERRAKAERDALKSEKASNAAKAGNQHNRAVQERAREYYESHDWPTKAAAIADMKVRFNRADKTIERWISKWNNGLDGDSA